MKTSTKKQFVFKQGAFTFVELLIALSLFTVGMLSVLQIFPVNKRLLSQTAETSQAAFLAQEQFEILHDVPYASLTVGTYQPRAAITTDTSSPYALFEREIIVSLIDANRQPTGVDIGLKKVVVTIYWQEHGINRNYQLATYVVRR